MNLERILRDRNRNRVFRLVLIVVLVATMAGCGNNPGDKPVSVVGKDTAAEALSEAEGNAAEALSETAGTTVPAVSEVSETEEEAVPEADIEEDAAADNRTGESGEADMIYAYVNGEVLSIRAEDNSSAQAFMAILSEGDITIDMHDYNSFEKVGPLGTSLPANDEQITTEPGDVILYQGNQITIYYDVNSWNFTRLGKIQNLKQEELKAILGDGDVTVRFSLREESREIGAFDFEKQTVLLNSGYEMPVIGLGTWTLSDEEAENSVYHALKSGVRLIDTARYYGNFCCCLRLLRYIHFEQVSK